MNKNIIKTSKQHKREKYLNDKRIIEESTCPECGYYDIFNGMIQSWRYEGGFLFGKYGTYNIYKCKECGCEWEIKQD